MADPWGKPYGVTPPRSAHGRTNFVYKDIDFWVMLNSHIQCGEDNSYWCEHIASALEANVDAEELWIQLATGIIENKEVHMDIPMIPTVNQWARIALVLDEAFKTPAYEVVYIGPGEDKTNSVGHIHPGEGRMIIRSMIFDWFRSMVTVENLSCQSSSHKYAAQMQWEKDIKNPKRKPAQEWSVWSSTNCLTCAAGGNASFDDLVPEVDKKESIY